LFRYLKNKNSFICIFVFINFFSATTRRMVV
jgi:hypothetical protein